MGVGGVVGMMVVIVWLDVTVEPEAVMVVNVVMYWVLLDTDRVIVDVVDVTDVVDETLVVVVDVVVGVEVVDVVVEDGMVVVDVVDVVGGGVGVVVVVVVDVELDGLEGVVVDERVTPVRTEF